MSNDIQIPADGSKITIENGVLHVPNNPIIPYIEGDGIGVDISPVMIDVVNGAVGLREVGFVSMESTVWLAPAQSFTNRVASSSDAKRLFNGALTPNLST